MKAVIDLQLSHFHAQDDGSSHSSGWIHLQMGIHRGSHSTWVPETHQKTLEKPNVQSCLFSRMMGSADQEQASEKHDGGGRSV